MGTITSYINKVETWFKELLFILLAAFIITRVVIPLITSGGSNHTQGYAYRAPYYPTYPYALQYPQQ